MKYIILAFTVSFIVGCASTHLDIPSSNRKPAETTHSHGEFVASNPTFVEKTIQLYPNLEIPQGSYFKKADIHVEKETCEVYFKKGPSLGITTNYMVSGDFGFYTGIEKSMSVISTGATSLPTHTPCPNNICEFKSEYIGAPFNGIQIAKMWLDPHFQNVTRMETEFRRGPPGMKFENMALQLKYTCTPEFIGM